jgi:cytochrome c oxidase accessory protein FixG
MPRQHLPVLQTAPGSGSLGTDGRRRRPYPADVGGRFVRARRVVYVALVALWAALPWIPIAGHPAVFLDVDRRQFFLFGASFNAQDVWLVFFLVSGFGFGLLFVTALFGRVWCGWACPQTVFTELLFRPIERLVNGSRTAAQKRARGPFDFDRLWRLVVTHGLYVIAAFVVAHVFLAYFVSVPKLYGLVREGPAAHPEAFAWMLGTTALSYVAFGLFREQFCVVMCPYGRLQSVLLDDDALVVGYDERRGEPRGHVHEEGRGACVDCGRCVVVCPTGIDIREGLQLDCIACTACIDACDEVMDRIGQPRGLVRYDSLNGLRGRPKRFWRPRIWGYSALLALGVVVAAIAFRQHEPFEANLLRLPGAPYVRDGERIRNGFELHVVNKTSREATFTIRPRDEGPLHYIVPIATVTIEPLGSRRLPLFVDGSEGGGRRIVVRVETASATKEVSAVFLGAER